MKHAKQTGFLRHFLTLCAVGVVVGGMTGGDALAGISSTKHNLGTSGTGSNHVDGVTGGTAEICVFCHTPHAADTSNPAPLWNKRLDTGATYTTYANINSSTMDAAFATDGKGGGAIGSVSLACLSCHDGTQAMDNIINAPGSGGLTADGGGADGLNWSWTGARVDATGKLTGIAALGADLSNDHPIGMQYCGGGIVSTGGTCKDTDFVSPTPNTAGSATAWWVDTSAGGSTARQKTDMILYTRNFSGTMGPSVECASCHDPHSTNDTFLRISNANSAVCLACHVK